MSQTLTGRCKVMSELCIKQCSQSNNPTGKLTFISLLTGASTHINIRQTQLGTFSPVYLVPMCEQIMVGGCSGSDAINP